MSSLFEPKGGKTLTTNTSQTSPEYVQEANKALVSSARDAYGNLVQAPAYTTAGINADQMAGYDLTRAVAQNAFGYGAKMPAWYTNGGAAPTAGATQGYAAQSAGPAAAYTAAQTGPANTYNAAMASAARVGGNDFKEFLNPYIQSAIDPAVNNMRRQSDINSAQIAARSAAAGSFGGSREAIEQGQNTRALGEQTSQMVSQMMSAGFDKATATTMANAQMQQQTNLANQAAQNNASQFNAGARNTVDMFNTGAQNTSQQANVGAANAMNQFNVGQSNSASQYGAQATNAMNQFNANLAMTGRDQDMRALSQSDSLATSQQARQMQAVQALLGIGTQQRDIVQGNLDTPQKILALLSQITPKDNTGTGTSVAPNTAPSTAMQILGLAASAYGVKK